MLHSFPSISSLPPANYLTIQLINRSTVFRKRDGDGATRTVIVGSRHRSPHELNEFFHQGQADAGVAGGALDHDAAGLEIAALLGVDPELVLLL